jgi:Flp pilus assembly protein TadG
LSDHRPILCNLIRNRAGNALPIMALIMALLMAFVGCGVDGARMYMVNARLQQACDAGVLAGRKAMTDATTGNTALDATATAAANAFCQQYPHRMVWHYLAQLYPRQDHRCPGQRHRKGRGAHDADAHFRV